MQTPISELPHEGLMLWEVHFQSSYFDNDSRMPGTVPVDERFFVVARNHREALSKIGANLEKLRRHYWQGEVAVNAVALENLMPARDASNDGRLGWHSTQNLKEVELSLEEDKRRYRLGVCLIPVEE